MQESGSGSSSVGHATQGIKQSVRSATENLKAKSTETASNLKNKTVEAVQEQKQETADRIGGYSSAIHDTADRLEEKEPNIAWFTHRAAERLQGVADYVRDRDFRSLKGDVENLARRHPLAFFGGLFIAGLAIGNIVKAAGTTDDRQTIDDSTDDFFPEENYDDESRRSSPLAHESSVESSPSPSQS